MLQRYQYLDYSCTNVKRHCTLRKDSKETTSYSISPNPTSSQLPLRCNRNTSFAAQTFTFTFRHLPYKKTLASMRALRYHGNKDIRLDEIPEPELRPGWVKIKNGW